MNLIWVIIVALVLLVILIKFGEMKHKYLLKIILVLVVFFVGTLGYVYIRNSIDITTYEGFVNLGRAYYSWLGGFFGNIKGVTGYAVQQPWGLNSSAPVAP